MVLLIFSLLSCTSYPKYSSSHTYECDRSNAPADSFEVRNVYLSADTLSSVDREIRWSGGDWTYLGMDDDSPFEACNKYSSSDPEYQLAAGDWCGSLQGCIRDRDGIRHSITYATDIEGTHYPSDSMIEPYATLFNRLRNKCNETPTSLKEMVEVTQTLLEVHGRGLTFLEIMNKANKLLPYGYTAKFNCIKGTEGNRYLLQPLSAW